MKKIGSLLRWLWTFFLINLSFCDLKWTGTYKMSGECPRCGASWGKGKEGPAPEEGRYKFLGIIPTKIAWRGIICRNCHYKWGGKYIVE